MPASPVLRPQDLHDRDLIAALKLRAAEAVLPDLERQLAALDLFEAQLAKKPRHIGEGEHGVERELASFIDQSLDHKPANAVSLPVRIHCQRANFAHNRAVEVQGAAANQVAAGIEHREVADILRHLELGARQHDPLGGVAVDEVEQRPDIAHARFANGAGHISLVPKLSPERRRDKASGAEPGAMRTWPTPCMRADVAAFNLACIPPVATPSAI